MTAEKLINEILNQVEALKKHKAELLKLNSTIDKQINDHYHIIELMPLNASQMSKVTKSLRALLKQRRDAKEEFNAVSNFLSGHMENGKSPIIMKQNAADREQKYRTEAEAAYQKLFS